MIIAATGHRPNKLGGYSEEVHARLRRVAREYLALSTVTEAVSGMALGWDTAFAEEAFDLGIPLVAAVPFEGQESMWPEGSRYRYRNLLRVASRVVIVSRGGYSADKMQDRNEWMVDYCHQLCALWDGSHGGTANCVRYATALLRPIDNVWRDFKS